MLIPAQGTIRAQGHAHTLQRCTRKIVHVNGSTEGPWNELFSTSRVGCKLLFTAISFKGIPQFILSMAVMYYQGKKYFSR